MFKEWIALSFLSFTLESGELLTLNQELLIAALATLILFSAVGIYLILEEQQLGAGGMFILTGIVFGILGIYQAIKS